MPACTLPNRRRHRRRLNDASCCSFGPEQRQGVVAVGWRSFPVVVGENTRNGAGLAWNGANGLNRQPFALRHLFVGGVSECVPFESTVSNFHEPNFHVLKSLLHTSVRRFHPADGVKNSPMGLQTAWGINAASSRGSRLVTLAARCFTFVSFFPVLRWILLETVAFS